MDVLIIGYGSIGKRHAHILKHLNCRVSLVTAQAIKDYPIYRTITDALQSSTFDYVIVANATYLHYESLLELIACDYRGTVLVEKPLFAKPEILPTHQFTDILVAYNLRFHDVLLKAKALVENESMVTFSAYVGQYLPTWREHTDYRHSYSAKKEWGGGVLRDLSHELDYCAWFCGTSLEVLALGGQYSALEITSDDVYSILMKCSKCPVVNLQLNYLNRQARRDIVINTKRNTIAIDLLKGELTLDGNLIMQAVSENQNTYLKQHQALIAGDYHSFSQYADGLYVNKLIEIIENGTKDAWRTL